AYQVSDAALANPEDLKKALIDWAHYRDNYGVKVNGPEEEISQFDTALGDVESVIMNQMQLVAAASGVPATKLLGTTPKGFQSTGEHESESYRKTLQAIQSVDLTPLLARHYDLVARSKGIALEGDINVHWLPLDAPDGEQSANIAKVKADRDSVL